jgi:hypothetical protein
MSRLDNETDVHEAYWLGVRDMSVGMSILMFIAGCADPRHGGTFIVICLVLGILALIAWAGAQDV